MDPRATQGAFSWMEWQGQDVQGARDFYRQVAGWTPMDMPMPDGSVYPGSAIGETPVGGFSDKLDPQWLPYITVDDVDRRAQIAVDTGGEVVVEPFDAPTVGRIAILRDPSKIAFALIRYPAA